MNKPIKLNIDPETQKKLRVMKYSNFINKRDKYGAENDINQDKLLQLKEKQEKEDKYFENLQLAHRIKEIKKENVIKNTIEENNKNNINISLIAGKPHFINYIIKNEGNKEETYHVVISNPIETKKNFINIEHQTVSLITDQNIWKSIVNNEKSSLLPPHGGDFNCISDDNYFILKPDEKIPLLIKLLSFDTFVSNKNFTVWIYKGKEPLEYLSITLVKVMNLYDHFFEFNIPDNRQTVIPIVNPFKKQGIEKDEQFTSSLIKYQTCTNSAYLLQSYPTSNNFMLRVKLEKPMTTKI